MKLHTYKTIKTTDIDLTNVPLHDMSCGLFRAPLDLAPELMPELKEVFESAPINDHENWEVDVKIHMLMKGQFPCIPNYHCDNVPRVEGKTRFDMIEEDTPPMYLWLSSNPTTQFLIEDHDAGDFIPKSHSDLANYIREKGLKRESIPAQTWISMDQKTPHRGTQSDTNQWRVFVRITHKSVTPIRPVANDYMRRHCQVYLDAQQFSW